ncbi:MAG: tape measure domain protein [Candidatus Accumulibacter sp. BA-94]|nr:MAG: tape measure domain protein [Candidatus Accumulibacter sp. BA-94]
MDDLKLQIEVDAGVTGKANVDAMGQSIDKIGEAEKRVQTTTERLDGAFAKLDIRSADKIEADILAVNQALLKLASSSKVSGADFDRAFAAGQAQIKKFREELNGASGAADAAAKRTDGLISTLGKLGLAFSGVELARQFLTVNVQLESMNRTFLAVTGSSKAAAAEMAYVHDVADRLGLPLLTAGKAYADLTAATKGTRAEGQATRTVFEAVAGAMSVAGKSADDTQGALLALSQMASKGVVAMEELRGQLGERLPGALNAVASGFGITTAELIKLVEAGQVTAEQLFPALAAGLDKLYGSTSAAGQQAETLTQKWEHLKNAIAGAFQTVGDAGAMVALKAILEGLEAAVVSISVGFVALGKTIGVFFAAVKEGDIGLSGFSARAKEAFAEIEKEARDKLLQAAAHNRALAGGFSETELAAGKAARSLKQAADGAAAIGAGVGNAGAAITRLNVAYGALEESSAKLITRAKEIAEARKSEAEATTNLAKALGTERQQLLARQEATRTESEALRALAEQRRADLTLSERHLAGIRAEVATRGQATDAEQKQIDTLKALVDQRRAEADAARGHALSAAVAASEAEKMALAYGDSSARVGELAAAYTAAQTALAALAAQQAAGIDVSTQLAAAQIAEAQAGALYRDALDDQTRAIEASVKQAQISVEQAGIRLAVEQQRTILDVARARGDERGRDRRAAGDEAARNQAGRAGLPSQETGSRRETGSRSRSGSRAGQA